jgi:hypothetical protein
LYHHQGITFHFMSNIVTILDSLIIDQTLHDAGTCLIFFLNRLISQRDCVCTTRIQLSIDNSSCRSFEPPRGARPGEVTKKNHSAEKKLHHTTGRSEGIIISTAFWLLGTVLVAKFPSFTARKEFKEGISRSTVF